MKLQKYQEVTEDNGMTWYARFDLIPKQDGEVYYFSRDSTMTLDPKSKQYACVSNHINFLNWAVDQPLERRFFYEVIMNNNIQKMKYDIDVKVNIDDGNTNLYPENIKAYVQGLIDRVITETCKLIQYTKPSSFLKYNSSTSTKESWHLILFEPMVMSTCCAKKIHAQVINALDGKGRPVFNKNEKEHYIDSSVYKDKQNFRMLGSTKRCTIMEGSPNYKGLENSMEPEFIDYVKSLVTHVSSDFNMYNCGHDEPQVQVYKAKVHTATFDLEEIEKIVEESLPGLHIASVDGTFIKLHHKKPYNCIKCHRQHESENAYLTVNGIQQVVTYHCFRSPGCVFMAKLRPDLVEEKIPIDYDYSKCLIDKADIPTDNVYDDRWVRDIYPVANDTILISSYLGTGKTVVLKKYLTKAARDKKDLSILVLSPRQAFARNITNSMNTTDKKLDIDNLGFVCYLDIHIGNLNNCKRLVIQMESLHKLGKPEVVFENRYTNVYPAYDVIVLDEIESLLYQFNSTTMDISRTGGGTACRVKNIEAFEQLIRKASIVIGADAFLQKRSQYVMSQLRDNVVCYRNNRMPVPREAIWCMGAEHKDKKTGKVNRQGMKNDFLARIQKSLLDGKKIVVISATKKKIDELDDLLSTIRLTKTIHGPSGTIEEQVQLQIKTYTSSSSDIDKRLEDITHLWSSLDVLMYTTTITVGVDYNTEGHFDEIFVYGSNYKDAGGQTTSCLPRDLFQASMRVRHLNDNKMTFCVHGQTITRKPSLVTMDDLRDELFQKENYITEDIKRYNVSMTDSKELVTVDMDLNDMILKIEEDGGPPAWYLGLKVYNEREKRMADLYYMNVFIGYTKLCGYNNITLSESRVEKPQFEWIRKDEPSMFTTREQIKEISQRIKENKASKDDKRFFNYYMLYGTIDMARIPADQKDSIIEGWECGALKSLATNLKLMKTIQEVGPDQAVKLVTKNFRNEIKDNHKIDCKMYYKRLEIIYQLNHILQFNADQGQFIVTYDKLVELVPHVLDNGRLQLISSVFNFVQPKYVHSDTGVFKVLEKVYGSWYSLKMTREKKQKLVNGKNINIGRAFMVNLRPGLSEYIFTKFNKDGYFNL